MTDYTKMNAVANHTMLVLASRIIGVIGVPFALWVTVTAYNEFRALSEKVHDLHIQIVASETKLLHQTRDRYTSTDAHRDFSVMGERFNDINDDIQAVSSRVIRLETLMGANHSP